MLAISGQVRRKADPAKGLVKEWVSNWRDARPVSSDASHRQITGRISSQPGNVHIAFINSRTCTSKECMTGAHKKICAESLQLLGDFYLKKGQRTRLPQELGSEILRHLDAASAALPV